jgi:FKBP-type peptidyl-prolyl cis-trans isomerase FklB
MKRQLFTILGATLLACVVCAEDQKSAPPPSQNAAPTPAQKAAGEKTDFSKIFKSDKEKISYAIGMWASGNLKGQLKHDEIDIDQDVLFKAFKDNLNGAPTQVTETQEREILMALTKDLQAKKMEKQKEMAEKSKKEGDAFLAANKTKPDVKSFDSGLQYQVLTEGTGETPKPADTVSVNYRGTLIDGTEFDSSKPGQPATFQVTGVIPGWTEALEHMKAGSKWKLFIPSSLAYGERGHQPKIPPSAALIFEVELVSVKPAPAAAAIAKPATSGAVASATPPLTSDIIKVPSADELKKGAKIETIKAEDIEKEKAKSNN